jgi:hypothetical protein
MRELAEIMSDEELFSLPLEIQQPSQISVWNRWISREK